MQNHLRLNSGLASLAALALLTGSALAAEAPARPLSPAEARTKVGEEVTVEMTVRAAKDRLEKRGEVYLDSELDFRDEKNFAVVITRAGAAAVREAGVVDPAGHFLDKLIRVKGVVKVVDDVPRMEVTGQDQVTLVDAK